MMMNRSSILAGFTAVLLSGGSAVGADLGGMRGGSMKDTGYMPSIHQGSPTGLYLRGDFGFASNDVGGLFEAPNYDLSRIAIDRNWTYGGGVGWYVSKNVRVDFTLDHRNDADVRGSVDHLAATVRGERQFAVNNLVGLFNVYYDFDLRSHFTPYVGVGLGFARNKSTAGSIAIDPHPTSGCAATPPTATCEATFNGAEKWNAAGALMAGLSARLHDRVFLDAGYRFLYTGGAQTGDVAIRSTDLATGIVTPGSSAGISVHDMYAHEFRVGVRINTR
jgi:opacity protein-like surface antigen